MGGKAMVLNMGGDKIMSRIFSTETTARGKVWESV